jgi:phage-related protein
MSTDINTVVQLLTQDAKLDLFVMDLSQVTGVVGGSSIFRFHAGLNGLLQPVVWQGNTYSYLPAMMEGFDVQTSGAMPRPKLTMSNVYSAVTALVDTAGGDITGAMITRKQTYARYLDAVNFPARTNLVNWSEDTTQWTKTLLTTALSGTVPDARGDFKAVAVTETAAAGVKALAMAFGVAVVSGQTVTAQVEIKPGTRTQVEVTLTGPFAATVLLDTDMTGRGKVLASSGSLRYSLQPIGDNGWFQLSISATANANGTPTLTIRPLQAGLTSYTGSTSNTFYTGRANAFTPAAAPTSATNSLIQSLPYQYIGSTYNPNPDTDPTRYLPDELYFIERKTAEDDVSVQFELSSAIDLEDLQLPRRMIEVNYCNWDVYTGEGCMYDPLAAGHGGYFDVNDNPVGSAALDICGRTVNSCKVRFGATNTLNFGGFPGARAYQY